MYLAHVKGMRRPHSQPEVNDSAAVDTMRIKLSLFCGFIYSFPCG